MANEAFYLLAKRLDELPNGFPATQDGKEIRLLEYLFTPDEATLAAQLRLTKETPEQIAQRLNIDAESLRLMLKSMAKRGLIQAGATEAGLGYGLLPFVVGIYEMQISRMNAELAGLFEDYFQQAGYKLLTYKPAVHRVIPVNESIRSDIEIQPHESVLNLLRQVKSWGVMDCICRTQKALIGDPCHHPVEVCMVLSEKSGAFDHTSVIRSLTFDQAVDVLKLAAAAGLVHSVSNNQQGIWYICNCCTCSCAILRAMAEKGIANVIARSSYVNTVDQALCVSCGDCVSYCQFHALSVNDVAHVDEMKCVGCGVCVPVCEEGALSLVLRPQDEIELPPKTEFDWLKQRAAARQVKLEDVL